jgi:hypothetical protein
MAYRAVIQSSTAAANGDVHLNVKVQSNQSGAWKLVSGGSITVFMDRASLLSIINNGDTLANRRASMSELFVHEIKAWHLDEDDGPNDSLNEALTNLLHKGFPQTVEL